MDSGRTTGWSGHITWPPEPQPAGRHRAESAPPAEAESEGLRNFDLGMVPASVTPPRVWRRAAWFSIASSAAVLSGLVVITTLIDHVPRTEAIDLPGIPRGVPLGLLPPTSSETEPLLRDPLAADPSADRTRSSRQSPGQAQLVAGPQPTSLTEPGAPGGPVEGTEPGAPTAGTTPSEQPPTSEAFQLLTFSDSELVVQRSDAYFAAVTSGDLGSAYELTTGELRAEGFEEFSERYAGAASIEVVEVVTDSSRTITTLRIVAPDGTEQQQRRELRFTTGEDLMIRSDRLVG